MKTILLKDAVAFIPDGASVMIGGFMGIGTPERLVDALAVIGFLEGRVEREGPK